MGDPINARTAAEIRQDLRFNVDYGMGRRTFDDDSDDLVLYNFADLLVQVSWYQDGMTHVRYGVLVDFEESAQFGEAGYVLEIPTTETDPEKITEAQVEKIKTYIRQMRAEFKKLLEHARKGGSDEALLHDHWLQIQKWLESPEGRWELLVGFHDNVVPGSMPLADADRKGTGGEASPSKYKSFYHWLIEKEPSLAQLQRADITSIDDVTADLQRFWMPFVVGRKVSMSVDWPLPYIAFADDYRVAHFDISHKDPEFFWPFRGFLSNFDDVTEFTAPSPRSYADKTISLRPTMYTPLLYWAYLIRQIDLFKAQNTEALREYYTYLTNISLIRSVFAVYGPLRDLSVLEMVALRVEAERDQPDYDGGISDSWWPEDHKEQIALGMVDLASMERLFAKVIAMQNKSGHHECANRTVRIESACRDLGGAFLSAATRNWYERLWNHNTDDFGFDLFVLKAHSLLCVSAQADQMYAFMRTHLYEHSLLDDPNASVKNPPPDAGTWGSMGYRSVSVTCGLWSMYYHVREKRIGGVARRSTPGTGAMVDWFRASTPSLDVDWWLHDKGLRKLANYLMGGGKMQALKEAEAEVLRALYTELGPGTRTTGAISKAKLDSIRTGVIKAKFDDLFKEAGIDMERPGRAKMYGHLVLNTYIAAFAIKGALESDMDAEATIAAGAAALGLASDAFGYVLYKKYAGQVSATASRAVARQIAVKSGAAAARAALAVGGFEALFGGAGGLLGIVMYGFAAVTDYSAGRRKDAILDGIAAAGVAITMTGLFLDSTVVGVVPGIVCNVIGVAMIIVAEVIKIFNLWENEPETYCQALFTNALDDSPPGMKALRKWLDDFRGIYWGDTPSIPDADKLSRRVKELMSNADTFDMFASQMG